MRWLAILLMVAAMSGRAEITSVRLDISSVPTNAVGTTVTNALPIKGEIVGMTVYSPTNMTVTIGTVPDTGASFLTKQLFTGIITNQHILTNSLYVDGERWRLNAKLSGDTGGVKSVTAVLFLKE